jgi:cytoskeletal protein RodZ
MYVDADSLGNYLRRERELQHVSLQDISAATKIQLRFLKDLENDAYDQLPPAPFVVGFLRACGGAALC